MKQSWLDRANEWFLDTFTPHGVTLIRTPKRKTLMRVNQRWPLVITLILAGLQIFYPARIWLVLLSGMIVVVALSFVWALLAGLGSRLERALLHTWVQVGDLLEEVITLTNDSPVPLIAAEVVDLSDIPGYAQSAVRAAAPRVAANWRQHGTSTRRGLYHLGPTHLRLTDPLGLFDVSSEYPETKEVLVFPPVIQNLNTNLMSGGGQGAVTMRQRSLQETAAVGSIRGYQAGDPIRRIHWPLSERHDTFVVKEFDREMGGDVWIALDLDQYVQIGHDEDSTLEDVVVWGASWAWHLLRDGKRVGMFAYGPKRVMIPPMGGQGHLWSMLKTLAPMTANTRMPLPALLDEITPYVSRGDALIVVTPSVTSTWPERLGKPGLKSVSRVAVLIESALPSTDGAHDPQYRHDVEYQNRRMEMIREMLHGLQVPTTIANQRERREAAPAARGSGNWDFSAGGRVLSRPQSAQAVQGVAR